MFLIKHLPCPQSELRSCPTYQRLIRFVQGETDRYLDEKHSWLEGSDRLSVIENCVRHHRRPLSLYLLHQLTGDGRYRDALFTVSDWLIARRERAPELPMCSYFTGGVPSRYARASRTDFESVAWGAPGYASVLVQLTEALGALDLAGQAPPELMRRLRWLVNLECERLEEMVAPLASVSGGLESTWLLNNMRFAFAVALLILREGFLGQRNPGGGLVERLARAIALRHRLPSGCHWERTPSYCQMVAYSEILLWAYLTDRDGRAPHELEASIRRGFEWLIRMVRPDGRLIAFNDSVPTISFGPLFWAGATFQNGRFQRLALLGVDQAEDDPHGFDEQWVRKTGSWGLFDQAFALLFYRPVEPVESRPPSIDLDTDTGLVILRHSKARRQSMLMVKPINPTQRHRHEDTGMFEWWVDGQPILGDPGVDSYFTRVHYEWLRQTLAHATIGWVEPIHRDVLVFGHRDLKILHRPQLTGQASAWTLCDEEGQWRIHFSVKPYTGTVWHRTIRWRIAERALELEDHLISEVPATFDWLLPGLDGGLQEPITSPLTIDHNGRTLNIEFDAGAAEVLLHRHADRPTQTTLAVRRYGMDLRWRAKLQVIGCD
jgi:hypothetical protein